MDGVDELEKGDPNINFVPCLKWIRRGMAQAQPEKLKLSPEELAEVIAQTQAQITGMENQNQDEDDDDVEDDQDDENEDEADDQSVENTQDTDSAPQHPPLNEDERIAQEYAMDDYDQEDPDDNAGSLGLGRLVTFADPRQDPYLQDPDLDDDDSDVEDMIIKPTDNLLAVGHIEGDAPTLEIYVYNDVEDAFYVHHDVLLPSFPLALEWLSYDPGEETGGNFMAVGTMEPVIDVWDLDVVDGLEPAYRLGQKGQKKKKIKAVGHKDAVLALAWNHHVEYILASGSVDQSVLLWDLSGGQVKHQLNAHMEKVQALQWHPFESNNLLTGCCDKKARVFDCRGSEFKAWQVEGEVEKVVWNHFNPFTFLVATDTGYVQMIDVRQEKAPIWTLQAHSEGVNGLSLSTQCPDMMVTVSSDRTMKVWDIANHKPGCVQERAMALGQIHCLENCPDAPFVMCMGGDEPSNNLKVLDIRESASVRHRFGERKLTNPLKTSNFGYSTINEAEPDPSPETTVDAEMASDALEAMALETESITVIQPPVVSGGAVGKFKKKEKKKNKKKKEF
ncbi:hypothetical protein TCAL_02578 [Tigriopus californicus]|uniref:Uncharacterized protein n=1 Tax=Tigriopus californicus TaxID=6832 RepID=A0A553P802_TIGCA|nr:periodic tryptophan protein 1 homolog [Tigriopus californicus]TRY73816.1 hypothetical protein TCAL_02578 [Tigriopus californicus]|eukprot:TCALIF_02578-PA protein Name:"Similar to Pwp1 Periodic tryptophan protein 1 homolog (Mus musculus)" AED:0.08 eAED:0.08 QI:146/1/0.87/1/1/1/8/0/561